jgi:hypothetical protein
MERMTGLRSVRLILTAAVCLVTTLGSAPRAADDRSRVPGPLSKNDDLRPILDRYCVSCHSDRLKTGGFSLEGLDLSALPQNAETWEKVVRKLRSGAMPPAGRPRPDSATYDAVASALESRLDEAEAAHPHPGGPLLHRLNRAEYGNAIRDLLALDVDPASLLPPDDSTSGFDNVADVLGVSPALLERYLAAADEVSALAVGDPAIGPTQRTYHVRPDASQVDQVEELPLGTRGGLLVRPTLPLDGEYVIKVALLQTNLGSVRGLEYPQQLEISIDGERVHLAPIGGPADFAILPENATEIAEALDARLTVRVAAKAGPRSIAATFLKRPSTQGGYRTQAFLRSNVDATDHTGLPHIESVTITGPYSAAGSGDTPSRRRIFICRPAAASDEIGCATGILSSLAGRAYRRPVTAGDMTRLVALFEEGRQNGGSFERGVQFALRGLLASAKFVFRAETSPPDVASGAVYRISDVELASRLSFFLWSSIPDGELLAAAEQGTLHDPAVLDRQVRRMLADPKAGALVDNFAGQWLYLRNLKSVAPDQHEFPDFDDNLRAAFRRETELFFESIIHEDRNVLDLLTADYTFVNERLARHYGIPRVYGSRFRRVAITDDSRRGLLGKGSLLLVTSHAGRTSPVVRGKWILDNLLGTPPPPPPPNVPSLDERHDPGRSQSVRERLEEHRANPACAGCHRLIDPLGFALEHFDAVGAWRTDDDGVPIDATGQLTDGTSIDGVVSLREAILKRPDVFVGTFTEKMLTYALGRSLTAHDGPVVRRIVRDAAAREYRFSAIVLGIVHSVPFQMRSAG